MVGVFEPAAGYLLVEDCVQAQLDAATAAGAELLVDTEVTGWTANDTEVRVRTANGEEFAAGRLIVAAGAWSAALMQELHLSLTVLRKSLFWYAANDRRYGVGGNMPVFLYEKPEGVFYGFPSIDARCEMCRAYRWPRGNESAGGRPRAGYRRRAARERISHAESARRIGHGDRSCRVYVYDVAG